MPTPIYQLSPGMSVIHVPSNKQYIVQTIEGDVAVCIDLNSPQISSELFSSKDVAVLSSPEPLKLKTCDIKPEIHHSPHV